MKHPVIPGAGPRIARVMDALGIHEVSDLRGRDPLYRLECLYKGFQEDRCPVCLADGGVLRGA